MNEKDAYLEARKISFRYERSEFSLNEIDLKLYKNDFNALTGENGCGKTTLGKLLTGILTPDKGEVLINGKNTKKMDLGEIGTKLGYLFQNPERQIFAASVYDDISFPLYINGMDTQAVKEKTEKIMKDLEIEHLKDKYPFNLSHGEKQRVALAGILINDIEYLILDEPTSALDSYRKDLLGSMLKNFNEKGVGIFIISHDEEFINKYCSRILTISKEGGKIL